MEGGRGQRDGDGTWRFLTNHAHVLLSVAGDPESRARDIAGRVGITERATQRILADLVGHGYLAKTKIGRRNRYAVNPRRPLRDSVAGDLEVGVLLDVLGAPSGDGDGSAPGVAAPGPS
ncbi:MAG TPA: winged helix-turn-helix domain-containing protein [Gaiellaceae bacterium]|nr:winged helix-turn-helix domain-containing protein [Gaiellaceae bacterium]